MKMMKKVFTTFLCAAAVISLTACGGSSSSSGTSAAAGSASVSGNSKTSEVSDSSGVSGISGTSGMEENIDGGWECNQGETSLDSNPEAKAAFEKAVKDLVGCEYEPVALLGSQVVAGTNYCILCRTTPVVPNAESVFSMVTVYEDLEGNAKITEVADMDLPDSIKPDSTK